MHNGENSFEVSLCPYKQCKHHTKDAFSVYKWIHFGNMSYMYGKLDHFLHICQQLKIHSNVFPPEIRPAPPLKSSEILSSFHKNSPHIFPKSLDISFQNCIIHPKSSPLPFLITTLARPRLFSLRFTILVRCAFELGPWDYNAIETFTMRGITNFDTRQMALPP